MNYLKRFHSRCTQMPQKLVFFSLKLKLWNIILYVLLNCLLMHRPVDSNSPECLPKETHPELLTNRILEYFYISLNLMKSEILSQKFQSTYWNYIDVSAWRFTHPWIIYWSIMSIPSIENTIIFKQIFKFSGTPLTKWPAPINISWTQSLTNSVFKRMKFLEINTLTL